MARRRGKWGRIQAQREAAQQLRLQTLLQTQAAKAAARAQKAYEQAQHADQKERARLYTESRIAHISLLNEQLDRDVTRLSNLLSEAILIDSFINLQTLKQVPERPVFNPGHLGVAEAPPLPSLPPDLRGIQKFIPGAKEKHAQEIAKAQESYRVQVAAHTAREAA
jgi:restriction system protein